MNPDAQAVLGILIAALGGFAVGLERQWSGHATGPLARFAGARTFTLLGILAGIAGWMWTQQWQTLAAVLLLGAVALIVAAYVAASRQDVDSTTEAAALVVLAAGLLAGTGHWALTGGVIAVTTLLLVEKSRLHALAEQLDDTSLRAAVRFAVMAVVILPLLPEGPYGPWSGIRPRSLWVFVLLFSGLSFAGYLARRAVGGALGYSVTGLLGGLISSTNVSIIFSRLSRKEEHFRASLAAGVVGASTVLFLRVLVATAILNPLLARAVLPYFVAPVLLGSLATLTGLRRGEKPRAAPQAPANPLQLWASVQMALVFQAVFYAVYWLQMWSGGRGILTFGALLGLADLDALTLSMARGASAVAPELAAQTLAVGIISNTAVKAAIALTVGAGRYRWLAAGGLALIAVALGASFLLLR
jgi:uncharacterized membrane protein (DUF4010 family)